jgi:isopenicillin N synthase-like dioxygenase
VTAELPVIDVSALRAGDGNDDLVGAQLDAACREVGFFYVTGHGVDPELPAKVDALARSFFALPDAVKAEIDMARGGRAWRGWFPVGGELTSGSPDRKEGIYFGAELAADDPRVRRGLPLHGPNLFPREPADLRGAVLDYVDALTDLGHLLAQGLAIGLGLERGYIDEHLTHDPTVLFRIFRYPPAMPTTDGWGVGEHTDYGLLTMLHQDDRGGLEVRTRDGWVAAPPIEGAFVCNIGDMLERLTGGRYVSTAHRVRNTSGQERVSLAFFFDPAWDADVRTLPLRDRAGGRGPDSRDRWDGASVFDFHGTYGEYLVGKVAKVFPALRDAVLTDE